MVVPWYYISVWICISVIEEKNLHGSPKSLEFDDSKVFSFSFSCTIKVRIRKKKKSSLLPLGNLAYSSFMINCRIIVLLTYLNFISCSKNITLLLINMTIVYVFK